jgi:hypothetical protein
LFSKFRPETGASHGNQHVGTLHFYPQVQVGHIFPPSPAYAHSSNANLLREFELNRVRCMAEQKFPLFLGISLRGGHSNGTHAAIDKSEQSQPQRRLLAPSEPSPLLDQRLKLRCSKHAKSARVQTALMNVPL